MKLLLKFILALAIIYALFVAEECFRIKESRQDPIYILDSSDECDSDNVDHTEKSYTTNCKGLGYSIKREYTLGGQTGEEEKGYILTQEEFWLFDEFLLWGWIS